MAQKVRLHFICGNMLTGKTTLLEKITKQVHNTKTFEVISEQNLYKNFMDVTNKDDKTNFHFTVQTFLLNNFVQRITEIFNRNLNIQEYDIISDTFPPATGYIFSNVKKMHKLITEKEFSILDKKYDQKEVGLRAFFNNLKKNGTELEIYLYFRKIDFNFSLEILRMRGAKEFMFYVSKLDYYENLHQELMDVEMYWGIFDSIFDFSERIKFYPQEINKVEDFDKVNEEVFKTIYGV